MKNLMLSEDEKKEQKVDSVLDMQPKYPHGLCLYIDKETAKKLEVMEAPEVGSKVMIMGMAYIKSAEIDVSMSNDKKPSFSLQITDMQIKMKDEEKEEKSASEVIYGD